MLAVPRTPLATLAVLLLAAAPASATGGIDRAYRFDATLAAHYPADGPPAEAIGATSFVDGLNRKVLDADSGEGVRVDRGTTSTEGWTVVLHVRLDQHTALPQRILGLGPGDDGIYARDGRLLVREGGQSTTDIADMPAAGEWFQLAVTRYGRVFVNGAERVPVRWGGASLGDEIVVFKDDTLEDGAGQLAGLWLFTGLLWDSHLAHVEPNDLGPPTTSLIQPANGWAAAGQYFTTKTDDGGRTVSRAAMRLEPVGGSAFDLRVEPHFFHSDQFTGAVPPEHVLQDAGQYDVRHSAVDFSGNVAARVDRVTVDGIFPTGLSLDATPETTSDAHPVVAGRVNLVEGDATEVLIAINPEDGPLGRSVRLSQPAPPYESLRAPVASDGTFSVRTQKAYRVGDRLRVGAGHSDRAANFQTAARTITIVAAPPAPGESRTASPAPQPPAPARKSLPARLGDSLAKQLRTLGLRRLRRKAGVALDVEADGPGVLRVELRTRGRRPTLLARGSATFRKAGRARVRLKPTRAGRRARRRAVALRVTFVPRAGRPATSTQPLVLGR